MILSASTTIGGNLTAASGAVIQGQYNNVLDGVTITPGTTYSVDAGDSNYVASTLINEGTVNIGSNSALNVGYDSTSTTILTGGGTINLANANSELAGYGSVGALVNQDNLIQGQGSIYGLSSFQNSGTVDADVSSGTLSINGGPTTNTGTLRADAGATLNLNSTTLTNFASSGLGRHAHRRDL